MTAKNRTFHRRYTIEFKGVTTNNFMVQLLDRMLKTICEAIEADFKQVEVTRYDVANLREEREDADT